MPLFPDITPLVNEIKKFSAAQVETNLLLKEILQAIKKEKLCPISKI